MSLKDRIRQKILDWAYKSEYPIDVETYKPDTTVYLPKPHHTDIVTYGGNPPDRPVSEIDNIENTKFRNLKPRTPEGPGVWEIIGKYK